MFLGDYLFAPQFFQRCAARGWSWKIPVMDIGVRCSIREYGGMYVTYETDLLSSGDNQIMHGMTIIWWWYESAHFSALESGPRF